MRKRWIISFLLITVTILVYWSAGNNDFVSLDDPGYVLENPHVLTGLTPENVRWAFTATDMANWHPLTWLSHMADCQLYGLNPGGHHLTSVSLHAANTALLFFLLAGMTGALWRSAFVAALFALHPLHVESVAWVSERKDVLSTLFFMVTLLAYARYVARPRPAWYLPALCAFALGLMAKPMLVTLPFVLLLLDYWPLGRYSAAGSTATGAAAPSVPVVHLILEKVPFFLLAAVSAGITIWAQQAGGAVASVEKLPFSFRIANALTAYGEYLRKTFWPSNLAAYYPFPDRVPVGGLIFAIIILGVLTALVIFRARRSPFLLVGWLWFLGTLVPVIGLMQVGNQAMADRYTYIPLIGLFIMVACGVPQLLGNWRFRRVTLAVSAVLILAILSIATRSQIGYWRNSIELFTHTIQVTSDNFMAHLNLGNALLERGKIEQAISHYRETVRLAPDFAKGRYNLGTALRATGNDTEAIVNFYEAIRLNPDYAEAYYNLGVVLSEKGNDEEAQRHYYEALRIKPGFSDARSNLGFLLIMKGKLDEGMAQSREALRLSPNDAFAHYSLGVAFARRMNFSAAAREFSEALRLNPADSEAAAGLQRALAELNKTKP